MKLMGNICNKTTKILWFQGDDCYCIDKGININHVMCSPGSDDCSSDCDTDKVKVYAFGNYFAGSMNLTVFKLS